MRINLVVVLVAASVTAGCSTTLTSVGPMGAIDDLRRVEAERSERELRAQHAKFLEAKWGIRTAQVMHEPLRPGPHDTRAEMGEWDR